MNEIIKNVKIVHPNYRLDTEISNQRYFADVVIISKDDKELQIVWIRLKDILEKYRMKLHKTKTKDMEIGLEEELNIKIENTAIYQVKRFKYFRDEIENNGKQKGNKFMH